MEIKPNEFTSYDLSVEEEAEAVNFTLTQVAYLQNLLAEAAIKKVNLTFDPSNPQVFLQREAELQGETGILRFLLSRRDQLSQLTQASDNNQ